MDEETDDHGNIIQKLGDGSTRITTPDGQSYLIDKEGNTKINLPAIHKVSLDNIFDLKSHVIMRDGDLTVHNIELLDGGTLKIAFTADGKLVEFSGQNIRQVISKDNVVVIKSISSQ